MNSLRHAISELETWCSLISSNGMPQEEKRTFVFFAIMTFCSPLALAENATWSVRSSRNSHSSDEKASALCQGFFIGKKKPAA